MIKLYGVPGSRALRSIWAAEEVGADYELVPTDFAADSKKPEYLAINPNGRVPALVDDDLILFDECGKTCAWHSRISTRLKFE